MSQEGMQTSNVATISDSNNTLEVTAIIDKSDFYEEKDTYYHL